MAFSQGAVNGPRARVHRVTELSTGIDFYCRGLGLALKRRLSPSWVELAGANLPIFLLANRPPVAELGSKQAVRNFDRHWTPVHLDFIVENVDQTVSRLIALALRSIERSKAVNMAEWPIWPIHLATALI